MLNKLPNFGTKEFNSLCELYFGGMTDRQRAINWFNQMTNDEKLHLESKYHTLLITDSNIERIYKIEHYSKI